MFFPHSHRSGPLPPLESWLDVGWFAFWMRAAAWVLAPALFCWSQDGAVGVLMAWLMISVMIEYLAANTTWLSLRPFALVLQIVYLCAAAWMVTHAEGRISTHWVCFFLAFALVFLLGSDVVAVRLRAIILFFLMVGVFVETRILLVRFPDQQMIEFLWPAGGIAALSRAFWPRSSHGIIQTSLDQKGFRIEIISYGMKKILAIGIRRP